MLGSAIFEAAIGTIVIYILLSLICLVLNEWVTRIFSLRSGILKKEIHRILGPKLAAEFVKHPLIHSTLERRRFPDYIPTSTFAITLIELAYEYTPGTHGDPGVTRVRKKWTGDEHALLDSLRLASTSLGPIQARIEKWFDLAMEETSGRFKRIVNSVILVFSAILVAVSGADTVAIASALYSGALRHLPTEFSLFWRGDTRVLAALPGLIVTWAAVSLGAPFWFDMLSKIVNLRQTGLPPDENKRQQT